MLFTQLCLKDVCHGNYIIQISEVDLDATGQVYQVGAHFKALGKGESMEPSVLRCIFLRTKPALVSNVHV